MKVFLQNRRKNRTRTKLYNITKRLRLSVFRSKKHIYAQIIDTNIGKTLVSASDFNIKEGLKNKKQLAKSVGVLIANKAKEKKIFEVVFDKGPYLYHGRIKELADGAREGGLKF